MHLQKPPPDVSAAHERPVWEQAAWARVRAFRWKVSGQLHAEAVNYSRESDRHVKCLTNPGFSPAADLGGRCGDGTVRGQIWLSEGRCRGRGSALRGTWVKWELNPGAPPQANTQFTTIFLVSGQKPAFSVFRYCKCISLFPLFYLIECFTEKWPCSKTVLGKNNLTEVSRRQLDVINLVLNIDKIWTSLSGNCSETLWFIFVAAYCNEKAFNQLWCRILAQRFFVCCWMPRASPIKTPS